MRNQGTSHKQMANSLMPLASQYLLLVSPVVQVWTPAGGGVKSRRSPPPPEKSPQNFWLYWRLFYPFSSYGGLFATFFLVMDLWCLFFYHGGVSLFWNCLPSLRKYPTDAHVASLDWRQHRNILA